MSQWVSSSFAAVFQKLWLAVKTYILSNLP